MFCQNSGEETYEETVHTADSTRAADGGSLRRSHANAGTYGSPHPQSDLHDHSNAHARSNLYARSHVYPVSHVYPHPNPYAHSHTYGHAYGHAHCHSNANANSNAHTRSHGHTRSYGHAHTGAHANAHSRKHAGWVHSSHSSTTSSSGTVIRRRAGSTQRDLRTGQDPVVEVQPGHGAGRRARFSNGSYSPIFVAPNDYALNNQTITFFYIAANGSETQANETAQYNGRQLEAVDDAEPDLPVVSATGTFAMSMARARSGRPTGRT